MSASRRMLLALLKFGDLATVGVAFAAALAIVRPFAPGIAVLDLAQVRLTVPQVLLLMAYLAFWHFALNARGLYLSQRLSVASKEIRDLATAVLVAVAPLAPLALLYGRSWAELPAVALFGATAFAGLGLERQSIRAVARRVRASGRNLRNVLIVGTGDGAIDLTSKLARREEYGLRVVAVIEADLDGGGVGQAEKIVARVLRAIERQPIDEVLVVLPLDVAQPLVRGLVAICEEQGITVRLIAHVADLQLGHASVDEIEGQPVLTMTTVPTDPLSLSVKRAVDVVAAGVGLVLLSPVLALVAAAIKLDSEGPILFAQERVGHNRRRFYAYKVRTMRPDADRLQAVLESRNEAVGPVFKIKDDPRITRLGKWLRQTSVDELPQLLNVLKGEMSLVGPRPLPVRDVERIVERWQHRRFSVKPGITCLWQVSSRAPLFDAWARSDMEYIDRWSLALDFKILMKTIPAVLSGQGAH